MFGYRVEIVIMALVTLVAARYLFTREHELECEAVLAEAA